MLKKLVMLVCLLVTSFHTYAAVVSYNGYSLDTDTNIVTGGGLQWLQWTETVGLTANQALAANPGYRMASNQEMAALLNAFGFGLTFDSDESTAQSISPAYVAGSGDPSDMFVAIFGDTYAAAGYQGGDLTDPTSASRAWFGLDEDADGRVNHVRVYSDNTNDGNPYPAFVETYADLFSLDFTPSADVGTALVAETPIPAAIWLFGSGLLGLVGMSRRKTRA